MRLSTAVGAVLAAAVLFGCSKQDAPTTPAESADGAVTPVAEHADAGIAWREGDVEDAFVEARDSGKPVLLYWGAKWCPPCNQLAATVFKRPDFIEQTQQFVAVHLDGDSAGAQQWGDYFGIVGYPTLIVLRPDRVEMMRISGGTDVEQFPRVLALALKQTEPVSGILETALTSPDRLGEDDWTLLASYGWEVDEQKLAGERDAAAMLRQLASTCPDATLKQRLEMKALTASIIAADEPAQALNADLRPPAQALLRAVLADPAAVQLNLAELEYAGADMLVAVAPDDAGVREALAAELFSTMDAVYADAGRSLGERADAANPEVSYWAMMHPDAPYPDALVEKVQARAKWFDEAAKTPQDRQASISHVAGLLDDVGDSAGAKALLTADLETSMAPYYQMIALSKLAEKRGDTAAALDWLAQAYTASEGPATRLEWGFRYVNGLLRISPDDRDTIQSVSAALIDDVADSPNAYYQRSRMVLDALGQKLAAWSSEHEGAAVMSTLQSHMEPVCKSLPDDEAAARSRCEAWPATA